MPAASSCCKVRFRFQRPALSSFLAQAQVNSREVRLNFAFLLLGPVSGFASLLKKKKKNETQPSLSVSSKDKRGSRILCHKNDFCCMKENNSYWVNKGIYWLLLLEKSRGRTGCRKSLVWAFAVFLCDLFSLSSCHSALFTYQLCPHSLFLQDHKVALAYRP